MPPTERWLSVEAQLAALWRCLPSGRDARRPGTASRPRSRLPHDRQCAADPFAGLTSAPRRRAARSLLLLPAFGRLRRPGHAPVPRPCRANGRNRRPAIFGRTRAYGAVEVRERSPPGRTVTCARHRSSAEGTRRARGYRRHVGTAARRSDQSNLRPPMVLLEVHRLRLVMSTCSRT